jgi:hypothetical protein
LLKIQFLLAVISGLLRASEAVAAFEDKGLNRRITRCFIDVECSKGILQAVVKIRLILLEHTVGVVFANPIFARNKGTLRLHVDVIG